MDEGKAIARRITLAISSERKVIEVPAGWELRTHGETTVLYRTEQDGTHH